MNKSFLILKREYMTRVKKKSFIISTLLVPVFMLGIIVIPAWLATKGDDKERNIAVYDESSLFLGQFEKVGKTNYQYVTKEKYTEIKEKLQSSGFYALLYIPANIYSTNSAQLLSPKQIPFELTEEIRNKLSRIIENDKREKVVAETGIPDLEAKLSATKTRISLKTVQITETGEEKKSSSFVAFGASYLMGFIIYFFVFMYGSMVMRSVMEEKKSRIVEVIISSVRPFQLMFGKIVGTALVGLTQVAIWIALGVIGVTVLRGFFSPESAQQIGKNLMESQQQMNPAISQVTQDNKVMEILEMIGNLNLPLILFTFIFYFLGGYLLYSSLMGAVGSAVDNDEDTQQLVFPITFPLILSIILLFSVAKNPEGSVAFWASMIPFTSPVCMLARIPYGVPIGELLLSMGLLVATTLGAIWAAAKIYRTGILMYGKKVNLKELVKWLRYKN